MGRLLRPDARRGDLIGAGAVALTLTVNFINVRFEDEWGIGVHFAYCAVAAALVIGLAVNAEATPAGPPPRWLSALLVTSFLLLLSTLANLADLLGGDDLLDESGTFVWIGLLLMLLMAWFSLRFDSGISTLLASLTFVATLVAFVDWVFSPDSSATFRWVLFVGVLALTALAVFGPDRGRHHTVGYVNAAGVALLAIGTIFGIDAIGLLFGGEGTVDAATGWELVILLGGVALLAYSAWAHASGPAYLGFLNLVSFVFLAYSPGDDGPSLIGWPLVLVLMTAGLLVAGLRPGDNPAASPSTQPEGPPPGP
jgi:hypothetical protein